MGVGQCQGVSIVVCYQVMYTSCVLSIHRTLHKTQAVYVPFAFMVVEVAMSPGYMAGGIFEDLAGILAGHMYVKCGLHVVYMCSKCAANLQQVHLTLFIICTNNNISNTHPTHIHPRYYFLKEIEPRRSGRDIIRTPDFMYVMVV